MCCDKFVFGLCNNPIRKELLKTHLRPKNTTKAFGDSFAEAKSLESVQNTNKIIHTTKGIDEAVNWTGSRRSNSFWKKHHDIKLRREPNTCHWFGDVRKPHKSADCPANGRSKSGGYDHFARVCLEQSTLNNKTKQPRNNNNPSQRSKPNNQPVHSIQVGNQSETNPAYMSPRPIVDQSYFCTNEQPLYYSTTYAMEQSKKNYKSGDKCYANLPCSSTGLDFTNLKFQIDSAATFNTISHGIIQKHFPDTKLQKSRYLLQPHGDSRPIKPFGQITLLCEKYNKYHTLVFPVLPSNIITGKLALLSGKDCANMGIIKINADNVISLQQQEKVNQIAMDTSIKSPIPKDTEKKSINLTEPLTKDTLVGNYRDVFTGVACLQPLVSFNVKDDVVPIQMAIYRAPLCKKEKEKTTIDRYVKEGILEEVNEPTPWCSNILCREIQNKFRVSIDPSQTIKQIN